MELAPFRGFYGRLFVVIKTRGRGDQYRFVSPQSEGPHYFLLDADTPVCAPIRAERRLDGI